MRYARIENGKVVEIGNFDSIEGRFHPSLLWATCAQEVVPGYLYDGAVFSAPPVVAPTKADVSAKRYAVETAGINFTYRTVPVPVSTARASQEKIDAARNMVRDTAWVDGSNWKFADGVFRPMTATEITDMCTAVRIHIKACFDNEATKFAEINATGTTDVTTGWPPTANITTGQNFSNK